CAEGWRSLRCQQDRRGDPLLPGAEEGWQPLRLSVGHMAKTRAARARVPRELQPDCASGATGLKRTWRLIGPDGKPYERDVPGALGGHSGGRIYGRVNCPAALRALARGGYVSRRGFFFDEGQAPGPRYPPCGACMPGRDVHWERGES